MNRTSANQKIELEAATRSVTGSKVRGLRAGGIVPAVLYGKGMDTVSLQVPVKEFERALKNAGESTLVYLNVSGTVHPTIIKDVARHPVSSAVVHADFYKVRLDEKIKAMVPVLFIGEAPAVKDFSGILIRNVNELEVEALPQDMPHEIEVNIGGLKEISSQLLVGDVKGHGWVLTADPVTIVASVIEPISEEALKASLEAPTTDISAVEEIKKEVPVEEGETVEGEATAPVASEPAKEE